MKSLICCLIVLIACYGCLGCTDIEEQILLEPPQGPLECSSTVKGSRWQASGIDTLVCNENKDEIICTVEGVSDNDIIELSLIDDSSMTCIKQCIFKFIFSMQGPLTSSIIVAPSPSISLYPPVTSITVSSPSTTSGTSPTKIISDSLSSLQTSTATATPSTLCNMCPSATASPSVSITVIASVVSIAVVIILTLCISGIIMFIISIARRRGTTRINEDNSDTQELVGQDSQFMIGAERQDLFKEEKGGVGAKPPVGGAAIDSKKRSLASTWKTSSNPLLKNVMDAETESNGAHTTKSTPAITKRGSESSGVQTMEESTAEPETIRSAALLTQFEEEVHKANKPADIKRINPLTTIPTI